MTVLNSKRTLLLFLAITLGTIRVCSAQDQELRALATSLTAQIKAKSKGPVATTTFVNPEYGPALSVFLVDRLNILLAKGNVDFDVVTRDRIEEAYREINLSLAQNYNAATFAKIGQHVGAKVLLSGSYSVQTAAAKLSLAVQIIDVETGRIIGGEVIDLPLTGDIKALLTVPPLATQPRVAGGEEPDKSTTVSGPLTLRLVSITKTRDGKRVQVVIGVRSSSNNLLEMALIPEELPTLLDETGATWRLQSHSGINVDKPNGQIHVWTSFPMGVETLLSFVFLSDSSDGTAFTLTGSVISRTANTPYDLYNPPRIPLGLSGMRVR